MPFSDDDLESWREVARRDYEFEAIPMDQIRGILARLEAAEDFMDECILDALLTQKAEELLEVWRKTAGKLYF